MNKTNNQKSTTSSQKTRFTFLKSMLRQAPLHKDEYEELTMLAKKFDKKMASYLEANRNSCCAA